MATGAFVASACGGKPPALGPGPRAVQTVIREWGDCLGKVGVPVDRARGVGATRDGVSGILLTVEKGATFFVATPTAANPDAVPDNDIAQRLIARGRALGGTCPK
jgi:hypothetical protein